MGYIESLLAKNEEIIVRTRQHWTVLARSFLANAFLVLIILVMAVAGTIMAGPLGIAAVLLWVIPFGLFIRDYLQWWNEEYLITNFRVIQAEGIINKQVMDSSLDKVNDVGLTQSFLGRMLDYGDIEILTASELGVNRVNKIVSPIKFKTEMLNQKEALGGKERSVGLDDILTREEIPALLSELDKLRKQGVLTDVEFQQKKEQLLSKLHP